MRILYVVPFTPWPIRVRSYNLLPHLAARHIVDLVCVVRNREDSQHVRDWERYCASVRTASYGTSGAVARAVSSLATRTPMRIAFARSIPMRLAVEDAIRMNRPDVIYVERWRALQYVPADCGIPIVCDPTDSMALYNKRLMGTGRWWERIVGSVEYLKFLHYEGALADRVSAVIFCSQRDLEFVRNLAPDARFEKLANGVDLRSFARKTSGQEKENVIFFSGNFDYAPNRHAATFFVDNVLPLIEQSIPAATFLLVGNSASKFFGSTVRGPRAIEIRDFVPKLQPYLASATVAVAPILVGAGVSNKIMEAFSVGTPVVATRMACGDLPLRHGEQLLIADTAEEFAASVVALLKDADLRQRLSTSACALLPKYDWEVVSRHLEEILLRAAGRQSSPTETSYVPRQGVVQETAGR